MSPARFPDLFLDCGSAMHRDGVVSTVVDVRPAVHYEIGHLVTSKNWPMDTLLRDVARLQDTLGQLQCYRHQQDTLLLRPPDDKMVQVDQLCERATRPCSSGCDELFQKLGLSRLSFPLSAWYRSCGLILEDERKNSKDDKRDGRDQTAADCQPTLPLNFRVGLTCRRGNDWGTSAARIRRPPMSTKDVSTPLATSRISIPTAS